MTQVGSASARRINEGKGFIVTYEPEGGDKFQKNTVTVDWTPDNRLRFSAHVKGKLYTHVSEPFPGVVKEALGKYPSIQVDSGFVKVTFTSSRDVGDVVALFF